MRMVTPLLLLPLLAATACSHHPADSSYHAPLPLLACDNASPAATSRAALLIAAADAAVSPAADQLAATDTALHDAITIVANNLSNAKTVAFKAAHPYFTTSSDIRLQLDAGQGPFEVTNRPLDMAIEGSGYFKVKIPAVYPNSDGYAFTRNGAFFVNPKGQLVLGLGEGYTLVPPITLPRGTTESDISISTDGIVDVKLPGSNNTTHVGQIQLSNFISPQDLKPLGGSLYQSTPLSGPANDGKPGENDTGSIRSGFLELSNVDPIRETARLQQLREWAELLRKARSK